MRFLHLATSGPALAMALLLPITLRADNVAILPFANVTQAAADAKSAGSTSPTSATSNLDWIGESIAENLRDALGSRGLLTVARGDVEEAYRRLKLRPRATLTQASTLKIGEALDATQIVFGTFEFTPDPQPAANSPQPPQEASAPRGKQGTLKITARVLDLRKLRPGPEFSETGNIEDLTLLEAHLAWRALSLLAPKLAPAEADYKSLRTSMRLDAEENYIRGLMARNPEQREHFFQQAARLDLRLSHAAYELGRIYYDKKQYKQAADWLQKINSTDVRYREASFLLGLALYQSGDFAGSQKAFQVVADAVPVAEVLNNLAAAQSRRGIPQSLDTFQKALDADPNDPVYIFNVAYALWRKGDFDASAARFRSLLARTPEDEMATLLLGMCLKKQGLRGTDVRLASQERLKPNYEERAYWELKALVNPESADRQ